jgi:hypothetical protein
MPRSTEREREMRRLSKRAQNESRLAKAIAERLKPSTPDLRRHPAAIVRTRLQRAG